MSTRISPPSVVARFQQESPPPPPEAPEIQPWIVGPIIHRIALLTNGAPSPESYAGMYRDGMGYIAYPYPNLPEHADVSAFLADVRVALVTSTVQELRSSAGEATLAQDITVEITGSAPQGPYTFADAGSVLSEVGAVAGDVLRVEVANRKEDVRIVEVTPDVVTFHVQDIHRVFGTPSLSHTLEGAQIIRNAAQFRLENIGAQAQASAFGDEGLVVFQVRAGEGIEVPEAFFGSAADGVQIRLAPPSPVAETTVTAGAGLYFDDNETTDFSGLLSGIDLSAGEVFVWDHGAGGSADLYTVAAMPNAKALVVDPGAENADPAPASGAFRVLEEVLTGEGDVSSGTLTAAGTFAGLDSGVTYFAKVGAVVGAVTLGDDDNIDVAGAADGTGVSFTVFREVHESGNGLQATALQVAFGSTPDVSLGGRALVYEANGSFYGFPFAADPAVGTYLEGYAAAVAAGQEDDGGGSYTSAANPGTVAGVNAQIRNTNTLIAALYREDVRIVDFALPTNGSGLLTGSLTSEGGGGPGQILENVLEDPDDPSYASSIAAWLGVSEEGSFAEWEFEESFLHEGMTLTLDGGSVPGDIVLAPDLLGSASGRARVHIGYRALRRAESSAMEEPAYLKISRPSEISELLGSVTGNPAALAATLHFRAAPTTPCYVLGVDQVLPSFPEGTADSYSRAFEVLESQEALFTVVALTSNPTVLQIGNQHSKTMSAEVEQMERVFVCSSRMPKFSAATLIANGQDARTGVLSTSPGAEVAISLDSNLAVAGAKAGDILVLMPLSADVSYLKGVDGSPVPLWGLEIKAVGDDPFDATVVVPQNAEGNVPFGESWDNLTDLTWSLFRPGKETTQRSQIAEAWAQVGEGFVNEATVHVVPDVFRAEIDGQFMVLPGYYAAVSVAALACALPPSTPLSEQFVSGYLSLAHSKNFFTKRDLNRIAGGGSLILVQDGDNTPLVVRHQLTSDTRTLESREASIVFVKHRLMRFYREALKYRGGVKVIVDELLDAKRMQLDALNRRVAEDLRWVRGAQTVSVEESETQKDLIRYTVSVQFLYPNNAQDLTFLAGG